MKMKLFSMSLIAVSLIVAAVPASAQHRGDRDRGDFSRGDRVIRGDRDERRGPGVSFGMRIGEPRERLREHRGISCDRYIGRARAYDRCMEDR